MDVRALLSLSMVQGIGPARLRALVNHFGDPESVLAAAEKELVGVEGIDRGLARRILSQRDFEKEIQVQLSRLNKWEARLVTFWDKEYPENLKKIYDPPVLLFVRGTFAPSDKYSVAIVGTRNPTSYGKHVAEKFSAELSEQGITIVSGLARGVDTLAHATAVRSGGRTLAVLGSGVDVIYPSENRRLADQILMGGAILSEYYMGSKPDAVNFPRRNRIISGMTLGTILIETDVNGGAMITAGTALDQNREVFAVPGSVFEKQSRGTNKLIREGRAKLVEEVADVLEELQYKLKPILKSQPPPQPKVQLTIFEQKVFDLLTGEPEQIDALGDRSGMATSDLLVQLLSLELKGIVKQLPGKYFVSCE
ncbi:MAG: DNA protecting protein DprA [Ignavibacteriae bacterium 37-53-5]|nr:MAG: DNA protecting protein DprA [Ignavibacteriae bacterium 37-53-5]